VKGDLGLQISEESSLANAPFDFAQGREPDERRLCERIKKSTI
jgi:hypothetical protein